MKTRNIIFITVLLITNFLSAQGIVKRQSFTINLEAYTGTWKYVSSNEGFRFTFINGTEDTDISYGSCLIGDYYYSKNNMVLDTYSINSIPTIYSDLTRKTIIIFATNGKFESVNFANPNELYMHFYDKQFKKKVYSGKIQLISPTQIRWILRDDEGVYTSDEKWVESGFSVPTDVIMTKKEQLLVR